MAQRMPGDLAIHLAPYSHWPWLRSADTSVFLHNMETISKLHTRVHCVCRCWRPFPYAASNQLLFVLCMDRLLCVYTCSTLYSSYDVIHFMIWHVLQPTTPTPPGSNKADFPTVHIPTVSRMAGLKVFEPDAIQLAARKVCVYLGRWINFGGTCPRLPSNEIQMRLKWDSGVWNNRVGLGLLREQ